MQRSYEAELMDDFSIRDRRLDLALRELKIINKFLGGISVTISGLKRFVGLPPTGLVIADIGSGSSDNLIAAKKMFPQIKIISVDKNPVTLRNSDTGLTKVNTDAFDLPFKNNSCDIIHAALFLHHFNEQEIKKLLNEFLRVAKSGIIINDLQRSYLALAGIKILTTILSKSEMVKNDGPLSVKRGFVKSELKNLLTEAGINNFQLKWMWAFRWMVAIRK